MVCSLTLHQTSVSYHSGNVKDNLPLIQASLAAMLCSTIELILSKSQKFGQNSVDKALKVWDITSAPRKRMLLRQKAHLQLKKHNYFNFAESKREAEESPRRTVEGSARPRPWMGNREQAYTHQHKPQARTHGQRPGACLRAPTRRSGGGGVKGNEEEEEGKKKSTSYREYEEDA